MQSNGFMTNLHNLNHSTIMVVKVFSSSSGCYIYGGVMQMHVIQNVYEGIEKVIMRQSTNKKQVCRYLENIVKIRKRISIE